MKYRLPNANMFSLIKIFPKKRNQCPQVKASKATSEAQIGVAKQPSLSTVINANDNVVQNSTIIVDSVQGSTIIMEKRCFICNTKTTEAYVNVYEAVTSHSCTLLYDYLRQFLNDEPSIRHESFQDRSSIWNSICLKCCNKIDEYDSARVTAAKLGQELKWKLSQTEAFYIGQQNAQKSNEPELIIGIPLETESLISFHEQVKNENSLSDDEIVPKLENENH